MTVIGAVGMIAGGLDARMVLVPFLAPHALTLAVWGAFFLAVYVKKFGAASIMAVAFAWSSVELLFNGEYSVYSRSPQLLPNFLVFLAAFGFLVWRIQWKKTGEWRAAQWTCVWLLGMDLVLSPLAWASGVQAFSSPIAENLGDFVPLVSVVAFAA
jgi:hypothetical protein